MANKFCVQCGAQIPMEAKVCPVCGAPQPFVNPEPQQPVYNNPQNTQQGVPITNPPKEKTTALILGVVSMFTGIHGLARFYTGHVLLGILQLITFGGCAIWTIIDIVMIANGSFRDNEGRPLKD